MEVLGKTGMKRRGAVNTLRIATSVFAISCGLSIAVHAGNANIQVHSGVGYLGEETVMKSSHLGEDVKLLIYLPYDYSHSSKKYPVLYLLDGEYFMNQAAAAVQFLSDCPYIRQSLIPQLIVVGIKTSDRNRDFTPTHVPEYEGMAFPSSGEADTFRRFLKEELMPFIEKEYRTK
jgi:predicted alpha/beta superfamily hydrolase